MAFDQLNLHQDILKAVLEAGYSEPTKIQVEAIPTILDGKDLKASAKTGSGKTAAFLWPTIHRMVTEERMGLGKGPRVLILVPTRELTTQIQDQANKYSKYVKQVKTVSIGGGVPYDQQRRKLSRPYDILIATPGRLIDYIEQGKIDLSDIEVLILDEADRMLDMGFIGPVKQIASETPDSRQTLFFSATLPKNVVQLARDLLNEPVEIAVNPEVVKHENIHQTFYYTDDINHKNKMLDHILNDETIKQIIIFTATKHHAAELALDLDEKGHTTESLHGDLSQRQRTKAISEFKKGNARILVATDIAARGIDIQSISHVVNFDLPRTVEDYIHRVGRTGRAGANGTAFSFISDRDSSLVEKIKKFIGQPVEIGVIPGLEPRPKKAKRSSSHGGGDAPRRQERRNRSPFGRSRGPGFQQQKRATTRFVDPSVGGEARERPPRPSSRFGHLEEDPPRKNKFGKKRFFAGGAVSKGPGKPGKGGKKNQNQSQGSWSRDVKGGGNKSFKIIRNTNRGK